MRTGMVNFRVDIRPYAWVRDRWRVVGSSRLKYLHVKVYIKNNCIAPISNARIACFTVGLTTKDLPKMRCRGTRCSTTFHSTGSRTPRHRQHRSTGRIGAVHFQEASLTCLSRQPSSRERYTALQRAGLNRPIPISSTGTRPNKAATLRLLSSQPFLSKKCVPLFEN
jgi:hypothetical protein